MKPGNSEQGKIPNLIEWAKKIASFSLFISLRQKECIIAHWAIQARHVFNYSCIGNRVTKEYWTQKKTDKKLPTLPIPYRSDLFDSLTTK